MGIPQRHGGATAGQDSTTPTPTPEEQNELRNAKRIFAVLVSLVLLVGLATTFLVYEAGSGRFGNSLDAGSPTESTLAPAQVEDRINRQRATAAALDSLSPTNV